MTISRLTVDKLGVKLYDRVSAVIAEIVANSYDADATVVTVRAPMGTLLSTKKAGVVKDGGYVLEVQDDGCGMTTEEVNDFFLKVGAERRRDSRRGEISKHYKRKVMGRKGVGKLAPFGVCQRVEVITSGGPMVSGVQKDGKKGHGYLTSHFIMERSAILSQHNDIAPYHPVPGKLDGTIAPEKGTIVRMTDFDYRRVPDLDDFERQMAQRFGIPTTSWKIILDDSVSGTGRTVGAFEVKVKPGTRIQFKPKPGRPVDSRKEADFQVVSEAGPILDDMRPGFDHEDSFYPVIGWVGYSDKPYKDQLMAGIRIYCRGKIAAQTALFDLKAGFTGEYDVRSYLIGELHADWLDEGEDLIRTDRQDILWSQELGAAFQEWGQSVIKAVGRVTREPMRQSAWDKFKEVSKIEEIVEKQYPGSNGLAIREKTMQMAQTIARTARGDELDDSEAVESFVQLSLMLGPHITLDEKLREAASSKDRPMAVVSELLKTARLAELASFGRIADERVRVIQNLERLKDDKDSDESEFQKLIFNAPWLINPGWSPITANRTFGTLRKEFIKFAKSEHSLDLTLNEFTDTKKRADFVFASHENVLQIIEIKKPGHDLTDTEMDRIIKYHELITEFLADPGNEAFSEAFPKFVIILICDGKSLSGARKAAYDGYLQGKTLQYMNWRSFLARTTKMHEAFLDEAELQKERLTTSKVN